MEDKYKHITWAAVVGIGVIIITIVIAGIGSLFSNISGQASTFMYFMSEIVKAIGVFVGIPAVVLGIWTYIRGVEQNERSIKDQQLAQTWRRKEFVAHNVKKFMSSRSAKLCMQVLDYTERRVELFPEEKCRDKRYVKVDRRLLGASLMWHDIKGRSGFGPPLVAIRDAFDEFFEALSQSDVMVDAALIEHDDLRPHLSYWLDLISRGHLLAPGLERRVDVQRVMRVYISKYHFDGVANLCRHLSKDIAMRSNDIEKLSEEASRLH